MSEIILNGTRKEVVLVNKKDILGHDLTILEEEEFQPHIASFNFDTCDFVRGLCLQCFERLSIPLGVNPSNISVF